MAEFVQDVGMQLTLSRMPAARAVVSVSHLNDMIYDRTLNGLNAGCVNIVEDSLAHRRAFQNSKNALFSGMKTTVCANVSSWCVPDRERRIQLLKQDWACATSNHSALGDSTISLI